MFGDQPIIALSPRNKTPTASNLVPKVQYGIVVHRRHYEPVSCNACKTYGKVAYEIPAEMVGHSHQHTRAWDPLRYMCDL